MFSCRLKKLKIQHHSDNLVRVQHLTFILNSSSLIRANYHLKSVLCKGNTVNFIQWFALGQCLSFPPFPAPAGRFYPRSFERGPCWEYLQCVIHRAGGVFWQGPAFPKYQSHMGILVLGAKYWPSDPLASCPSTQPHHLLSCCLPHTKSCLLLLWLNYKTMPGGTWAWDGHKFLLECKRQVYFSGCVSAANSCDSCCGDWTEPHQTARRGRRQGRAQGPTGPSRILLS